MQELPSNSLAVEVYIRLAKEAFDDARANLELASVLTKNGENYLQLAGTVPAMNGGNSNDNPATN
jgi:hypothetical protein